MHIKTTLRFHLTPIRMTIIKNASNNRWCGENVHSYMAGGTANWGSHSGKQYGYPLENLEWTTIWPSYPTPWFIPKGLKISILQWWSHINGDRRGGRRSKDNGIRQTSLPHVHAWLHKQRDFTLCTTREMKSCTPFVYNESKCILLSRITT